MLDVPTIVQQFRQSNKDKNPKKLVGTYYILIEKIRDARSQKDGSKMFQYAMMSLPLIETLILDEKKEFGKFEIEEIPAIDTCVMFYGILGNENQLKNLMEYVKYFPELEPWEGVVEEGFFIKDISNQIYKYVKENEGCLQKDLQKIIKSDDEEVQSLIEDGELIRDILYHMDLIAKIKRRKKGNTYSLFMPEETK
jgi:hypothetical protein